ncbi:hypothetical protein ACFSTC_23300 [Nonomuraea ferruginea]
MNGSAVTKVMSAAIPAEHSSWPVTLRLLPRSGRTRTRSQVQVHHG